MTTFVGDIAPAHNADGINDNKSYILKDGKSLNFKNQDVNWGGKLDSKHSNELNGREAAATNS